MFVFGVRVHIGFSCMYHRCQWLKPLGLLRDKRVMVMNKNSEIYLAFRHKKTFHQFFLSTDDPV